jgi:hypothetical protein
MTQKSTNQSPKRVVHSISLDGGGGRQQCNQYDKPTRINQKLFTLRQ